MKDQLASLTYNGNWKDALALLGQQPDLVNAASTNKGYTPLHQAAWHGATLPVIGALLALGADCHVVTKEGQTARDIARLRHPDREDLQYILSPSTRSLAQLLRKLIAETPNLFSDYDGNRLLCDRLIACLSETWIRREELPARDSAKTLTRGLKARLEAAVHATTGLSFSRQGTTQFMLTGNFEFSATADFVLGRLLPQLHDLAARAALIPLEPHWTVLADLFEPAPDQWGLRGDPFLWMELRQALCYCELGDLSNGEAESTLEYRLAAAVATLTGTKLGTKRNVHVPRYARGGMSSGMVNCEHWHRSVIPLLARRAAWLRQSWIGMG